MILSVFVNDPLKPLEKVREENVKLTSIFLNNKVKFTPFVNFRISEFYKNLNSIKNEIKIFHFSGHSSNEGIELFGDLAKDENLIEFLNREGNFPQLECVVINGCANEEIIDKLNNIPIVIGTKSAIDDKTAMLFSEGFYTSLIANQESYQNAFKNALAIANVSTDESITTRSIGKSAFEVKLNQWKFIHDGNIDLSLGYEFEAKDEYNLYSKFLTMSTAHFDPENKFPNRARNHFIQFPTIIAKEIKKYFEPSNKCTELGQERIESFMGTVRIVNNFLRSIVLAFAERHESKFNDFLKDSYSQLISNNQSLDSDYMESLFSFLTEIYSIEEDEPYFDLIKNILALKYPFINSISFSNKATLDKFNDQTKKDNHLNVLLNDLFKLGTNQRDNYQIEEYFCEYIRRLFFLSEFNLLVINNIDYFQFQHSKQPQFRINSYVFEKDYNKLTNKIRGASGPKSLIDNVEGKTISSIYLTNKNGDVYLNLSPFLINHNAFVNSKDQPPEYYFFDSIELDKKRYKFIKTETSDEEDFFLIDPEILYLNNTEEEIEYTTKNSSAQGYEYWALYLMCKENLSIDQNV